MSDNIQKKTTREKASDFEAKEKKLQQMGGEKQINKQHESGKMTARERLATLFDEGTFQEVQLFCSTSIQPLWTGQKGNRR